MKGTVRTAEPWCPLLAAIRDEQEHQPDEQGPADVTEDETGQGQAAALLAGLPDLTVARYGRR